ncbi:MAG TPA: DUF3084 domain-containing protein [Armatimonadota bacterium]|nr:DUF3084 domain-containing protein [Armatimonadota bacterium]
MGTAFIILLLLALCGFIAYIGDLLGRRFGKRRLSIFGLRPKHTAILLTVATGVLIAAFTFCAALATLPWFRSVVTRGERLANQNIALRLENLRQSEQNERLQGNNRGLRSENQRLQGVNGSLESRNRELAGINQKLRGESETLKRQNASLQESSSRLRAQNGGLRGQNARLAQSNTRLETDVSDLRAERRRLGTVLRQQRSEVERLQALAGHYQSVANHYKDEQYTFRRGQLLISRKVLENTPTEVLRTAVDGLMYEVTTLAREAKARPDREHSLVYYVPPAAYPEGRPTTPDAIRDWLVQRMQGNRQHQQVIRAIADENCVEGQPVAVRLDSFINTLVFGKGQLITQKVVDGSSPERLVFADLMLFLQGQVRMVATSAPNSMVPSEEGEGLGEADWGQLLDACRQIKKIGGPAILRARARTDVRRAGPLNLEIEVARLDDAVQSTTR